MLDRDTALARLAAATADLLYLSESEAPFELVQAPSGTKDFTDVEARQMAGEPAARVERVSVADFFAGPTREQDWHEKAEKDAVGRYRTLRDIFVGQLASSQVFRVGSIRIHVMIVGQTSEGAWVGIKTLAVES